MKRIVFGILTAVTAALTLAASPAHAEEYRGGYYDHGNGSRCECMKLEHPIYS